MMNMFILNILMDLSIVLQNDAGKSTFTTVAYNTLVKKNWIHINFFD